MMIMMGLYDDDVDNAGMVVMLMKIVMTMMIVSESFGGLGCIAEC